MIEDEAKKIIHDAADAFGIKEKHEKRIVVSLNVISLISRLWYAFKNRSKKTDRNDD